ncbi:MFS transporter [Sodalis sp. dw_96]|uniref:MFS transporter n=1 Tax=Sodalis sp. dw_96 TaxID=2719794 RepID=UPI001BD64E10|nr:MFS transporter [Sodalis sp. dw_96]
MEAVFAKKGFPPIINALVLTSVVLTIGRGLTLPFLALYFSRQRGMTPGEIGLVLGSGLTLGIIFNLYGGYLVDRFNKHLLILGSMILFALSFFLLPECRAVMGLVLLIGLINSAYGQFSITLKATIAEWLPVASRIKAFSANYTLVNVGWAVGPPLGVMVAKTNPTLPFYLAGVLSAGATLIMAWILPRCGQPPVTIETDETSANSTSAHKASVHDTSAREIPTPQSPTKKQTVNFRQVFYVLGHDKRLMYFTLGGALGSLVCSQFASCISQFLMVAFNSEFAYRVVGLTLPTNAAIVITLQYLVSRNIRRETLMPWLVAGSLFFIIGLVIFTFAHHSLPLWIIGVAIFSLGEIIIIPVEYLFIDFIAPPHLKGSYYGMQNLGSLGGAANPLLTGFVLTYAPPVTLFWVLILATLISLGLFYRGFRYSRRTSSALG